MLFEADYAKNYASILYQCLPVSVVFVHLVITSTEEFQMSEKKQLFADIQRRP